MGLTLTADRLHSRLKLIRTSQGRTQKQWADDIDVSLRAYSDYERGETPPPFDVLVRIARRGGVPLTELVAGLDEAGGLGEQMSTWSMAQAA